MGFCISVIPMSWPPRIGGSFPGWMLGSWKRRSIRKPMRSSPQIRDWPWRREELWRLVCDLSGQSLSGRILRIRSGRCGGDRRRRHCRRIRWGEGCQCPGRTSSGTRSPRRDHLQRERRPDRDHRGRQTARSGTTFPHRGPESCDVMSSTVTVNAPSTVARSTIGSRSIMSSPGPMAEEPMRTI